jgi:nucleotide-binding universal stress UspA family protein
VCGKGNSKIAGTREVSIRRILVPTDFSNYSRAALQYAVRLAKRFDAQLTLMNVIHPNYFVTNGDYIALDYPSLLVEVRRAAKHDLASLVKETAFQGVPFRALIDEGHPGDRIVDYAEKCGADLIVSATHGRTGLRHALIGSTAEYVVRHAKCPVLVVPRSASTKATSGKTK